MNVEHINFSTIREDFSIYEIEDGLVLRTKQIVTDIVVETTEDNRKMTRLAIRDVSFVVATDVNKIDTTNFEVSTADNVTEKDQINELKFRNLKEVINIYETDSALLFLTSKVQKIFLTNKKDNVGVPILRHETLTGFNLLSKDTLNVQPPLYSAPILTKSELDIYSERFLCELCKQTNRMLETSRRKRDVYDGLRLGAFLEKGIPQVIDEIVQDLIIKDMIAYGDNRDEIRLTFKGLSKCKECKD
jgi:hypothetical protein